MQQSQDKSATDASALRAIVRSLLVSMSPEADFTWSKLFLTNVTNMAWLNHVLYFEGALACKILYT